MIFAGSIKQVGEVESQKIADIIDFVRREFDGKWRPRSLEIMRDSLVLKAITPTDIDRLASGDEQKLTERCLPFFEPFVAPHERIVYMDVSCLPPGKQSDIHFDYAWIHIMSRRLRIPLITNPQAIFACLEEDDQIRTYNLKVGRVYETNNSILHCAINGGLSDRWHMVADVLDLRLYEYLKETGNLSKPALHKSCNFHYSTELRERMHAALRKPATSDF